jgi:hypothetical protein
LSGAGWKPGQSRPSFGFATGIIDVFDLTLDGLYLGRTGTLRHSVVAHPNDGR